MIKDQAGRAALAVDDGSGSSEEARALKASDEVDYWKKQIDEAQKREKDFRKDGKDVVEIYETEKSVKYQYNILYSNTETMAPALYNSTPRPVVQRRFKDADPVGKKAATVVSRLLEFLVDTGTQDYSPFDELMKSAVLEALVPGRGVTLFKYDAYFEQDGEAERVKAETVCGQEVPWDRFLHGYAKKWTDVPWIAFEHMLTRQEAEETLGPIANSIPLSSIKELDDEEESMTDLMNSKVELVHIFQIWVKATKKVLFYAPAYPQKMVKKIDDPLNIDGFYPCPKPLTFFAKISTITPVNLYSAYKEQAEELNAITIRINRIVRALKVRGGYDNSVEGLDKILEADDNTMVPLINVASLGDGKNLDKALWLVPIEKLVVVLQQLYLQRSQCKQVIFEIMGLADIMRGSSSASETLGAQEIKQQWGTLRLKRLQKEVMRYTRDCLRIMAEIAVNKFSPQTLKAMTGLPYPMQAEKEQAQQMLMLAKQQAIESGVQPEQMQQVMQQPQIAQAAAVAQETSWEELQKGLQNDLIRVYRIDIETNSTVDAEATEDKQQVTELVNAMAQFLNGIAPLVKDGFMPLETAKEMLLAIIRRFRFGSELEDSLKQITDPKQQQPDPKAQAEQQAMQAEQQKHQLEAQSMQQELEFKQKLAELDIQTKQMELKLQEQKANLEMQILLQKSAVESKNMQLEDQFNEHNHAMKMQQSSDNLQMKRAAANQAKQTKVKN